MEKAKQINISESASTLKKEEINDTLVGVISDYSECQLVPIVLSSLLKENSVKKVENILCVILDGLADDIDPLSFQIKYTKKFNEEDLFFYTTLYKYLSPKGEIYYFDDMPFDELKKGKIVECADDNEDLFLKYVVGIKHLLRSSFKKHFNDMIVDVFVNHVAELTKKELNSLSEKKFKFKKLTESFENLANFINEKFNLNLKTELTKILEKQEMPFLIQYEFKKLKGVSKDTVSSIFFKILREKIGELKIDNLAQDYPQINFKQNKEENKTNDHEPESLPFKLSSVAKKSIVDYTDEIFSEIESQIESIKKDEGISNEKKPKQIKMIIDSVNDSINSLDMVKFDVRYRKSCRKDIIFAVNKILSNKSDVSSLKGDVFLHAIECIPKKYLPDTEKYKALLKASILSTRSILKEACIEKFPNFLKKNKLGKEKINLPQNTKESLSKNFNLYFKN
jgi:hypothetical protein